MAITIDWGTSIISIPKADLALIQSNPTEIRELDVNSFRLTLKDLEDGADGMGFLKTHNHNTEVTLAGLTFSRVVEILDPYTVTFEDSQYAVNLTGGNNNIADKVNVNQVSVRTNNSAGLISTPLIEFSSFEGGVWWDSINGSEGTVFPVGTHVRPAKNLSDVKEIASYRGFDTIYVLNDGSIDTGLSYQNFLIKGRSAISNLVNISSESDVLNTRFQDLTITGIFDGNNTVEDCVVSDLTYFNGSIKRCGFTGTITLAGSAGSFIENCYMLSFQPPPTISINNVAGGFGLVDYFGLIVLANNSNPLCHMGISLRGGTVILDDSVTAGVINIGGFGLLQDSYGNNIVSGIWNGGVVISNLLVNPDSISEFVWNRDISQYISESTAGHAVRGSIFRDAVFIDTHGEGSAGVEYPTGSPFHPSDNFADAFMIASGLNIKTFKLCGSISLDRDMDGYSFEGSSSVLSDSIYYAGYNVSNSRFSYLTVSGEMAGENAQWEKCLISDIQGIDGVAVDCGMQNQVVMSGVGDVFLGKDLAFVGSSSNPTTPFVFDVVGAGRILKCSGSGYVQVDNMETGAPYASVCQFGLDSGRVDIDSSCTGGIAILRGSAGYTDNSGGSVSIVDETSPSQVWDVEVADHTDAGSTGKAVDRTDKTVGDNQALILSK